MSGPPPNPNDARYQAYLQQQANRQARDRQELERQARIREIQLRHASAAVAAPSVPAPPAQPQQNYIHPIATGVNEHRAHEPVFDQDTTLIPYTRQILPQRPIASNDRVRLLNPGARATDPTDRRQWQPLFRREESRTPPPPALPNQAQPPQLWNGARPTFYGFLSLIQGTSRDGQASGLRFPLQISPHGYRREFIAPLPWVTEDERQRQQTVVDPGLIAPFYQVRDPDQDQLVPRSTESAYMRQERIELGRYGDVPFCHFATIPAYPPHTPEGRQLPLQEWMPPYNMPRHPVMAYWGHDLTRRIDNPRILRLPEMLVWNFRQNPNIGCTFVPRPMFMRTANDHTDRGWGPGVQVHPSLQPSLARATEHMQRLVLRRDAERFRGEERALNQAAGVAQEPSPVVYSPASDDGPMDDVSEVSEEDNDDERDGAWPGG